MVPLLEVNTTSDFFFFVFIEAVFVQLGCHAMQLEVPGGSSVTDLRQTPGE